MRIYKDFSFDAAHHLPTVFPPGHPNHRLHGHSYRVRVVLDGRPDPETGMIAEFGALGEPLARIRDALDHRYLNEEVPGLERPTLEAIAVWIWRRLAAEEPALWAVEVHRDSDREGCVYQGEFETGIGE
ncbi:MAG: 6-carboxytetrahydropterin synthase [Pseudomonadota bacterium]